MNSLLLQKLNAASPVKRDEIKKQYHKSPLMLRFVQFIEKQQNRFSTADAVIYIYEVRKSDKNFSAYQNRFYKLRKKLIESFGDVVASYQLPDEQQWLREGQMSMQKGKFKEAQRLLTKAETHCWRNNIFEILPEVIDALIQTNQALNTIDKNKVLHKKFPQALALYTDLSEAKNIVRKIYEVNLQQGIQATRSLYKRLAKLVVKNRTYPRFKLLYNFIAAYYKTGAGGKGYLQKTYAINRHIAVAQKLMNLYPHMPALHYTPGFLAGQFYRLHEIQALGYYNSLRYKEAAEVIAKLYAYVMQNNSAFSRLKNEVFFTNAIHMFTYAGVIKSQCRLRQTIWIL
ncbi:MAG: hypothetical protein JWO06_3148 [Bacteroidota bacterium]|nr:hypothetical protein [Bacteroidota bacterium]